MDYMSRFYNFYYHMFISPKIMNMSKGCYPVK